MTARRQELETNDLDGLFRSVAREEAERVIKERLPQFLRSSDTRRPPLSANQPQSLAEEYYTRREAAQIVKYSERKLQRLIDANLLQACGTRRDRITRAELERFMASTPPKDADETGPEVDPDADVKAEAARLGFGVK